MNIQEKIAEFARANKISKVKTEAFVKSVMDDMPKLGRKTTDESLRIREAIKQSKDEFQGIVFTAKELASKINAEPVNCINALKWLADHENVVVFAGKKEKEQGKKGRKETLWQIA